MDVISVSQHGMGDHVFATSCDSIVLGIKRLDRVRNTQIHEMTNTRPLINTVGHHQLRFLGHTTQVVQSGAKRKRKDNTRGTPFVLVT